MSLLDHPTYVHGMFDTYFRAAGGRFAGRWREGVAPAGATPFATFDSPPLWDVVRDINKLSNNVMARQLFLTLATARAAASRDRPRARPKPCEAGLARRNLRMPELVLDNGSGLSRTERISAGEPRAAVGRRRREPRARRVRELARRRGDGRHAAAPFLKGTVAGQALLKTGTLDGVRALAGYVIDNEGRRFAVVAIVNHPNAVRAQGALDFLVQWVYQYGAAAPPAH